MKNIILVIAIMGMLLPYGCTSSSNRQTVSNQHAGCYVLYQRMGTSNPPSLEELQQAAKSNFAAWEALDRGYNGWTDSSSPKDTKKLFNKVSPRAKQIISDEHALNYVFVGRIGTANAPTLEELQIFTKANATAWQAMDSEMNGWSPVAGSIGMISTPVFTPPKADATKAMSRDLNDKWIDNMLTQAKQPVRVIQEDGTALMVSINQDLISFIEANRYQIAVVGQAVFTDFITTVSQGQSFQALVKVYSALSNKDLVSQSQADAVSVGDDSAQMAQAQTFWITLITDLLGKIEPTAFSAILAATGI